MPALPACGSPAPGACGNVRLTNQLDGFSVNPRVTVCFSGPINPNGLTQAIHLVAADTFAAPIGVNQTIYDPIANCAHAKPDRVLAQDTRYLLLLTGPLSDASGQKVTPVKAFSDCLKNIAGDAYCSSLSAALKRLGQQTGDNQGEQGDGVSLLSASLFTTLSATDWMEKAHAVTAAGPAVCLPAGAVSTFKLAQVQSMTYVPQDNTGKNTSIDIPTSALAGVDSVAFGLFLAPNFLNIEGPLAGSFSVTPTGGPIGSPVAIPGLPASVPPGYVPVSYHVFLPPVSRQPTGGFPVVIYGHGLGDNQFGAPTYIASTLAKKGYATLAIEIQGHGFGPNSYVAVVDQNGTNIVATPGRGVLLSAGGAYGQSDGCIVPGPLAVRDCGRQTALDLSALVHTIQGTNGLGINLDPNKIFYVGQSFGGVYGTLFHALEPAVSRAVLNVSGGTTVDVSRLAITARPLAVFYLSTTNPALLNVPPPINAPSQAYFHDAFNDNYTLRDQPVAVNNIPGAMAIQDAFEGADWLGMVGDPLAYAAHLKTTPLSGVPAKETMFQFGYGDLEIPNPTESALVRAAGEQKHVWFFRFDRAVKKHPELLGVTFPGNPLPVLPHRYMSNPTIFGVPAEYSVSMAVQKQIAGFFSGLEQDPNSFLIAPFAGKTLFEVPDKLPEDLNFLQLAK
jgi:dienelactone hydrolase